jgi:hypothetical protein
MLWLIQTEFATSRQLDRSQHSPGWFLHFRACHAFRGEGYYLSIQIVTHQIELMLAIVSRVECGFSGWQCENQPSMPGVDRGKAKDVFEESAISISVLAVDDHVRAINHNCGPFFESRDAALGCGRYQ